MKYKIFISSVRREFEYERRFIKQEIENISEEGGYTDDFYNIFYMRKVVC